MVQQAHARRTGTVDTAICWQAITERDTAFDGAFVYADATTGTFCRPSCEGQRPHRDDVTFFTVPEAAESAGFRPCARCLPKEATARDPQVELIRKACQYVQDNIDSAPTLADISAHVSLSPFHFQRTFKRVMGITPRQYADACRLERLKLSLRDGDSVTYALYNAGYSSSSRLYERSFDQLGMTPATYRRGGEGMEINYIICDSSLGLLLVAQTERGICSVHLGETEQELVDCLHREYPQAVIHRNRHALCDWVMSILDHLDGWQPHIELPIDVQATAFQWRVWQAVCAIPYGETRTYREIAEAIGLPGAAAAVAQAVDANPVALLIPCHRTGREDGEASSRYSTRAAKVRRRLLDHEQQVKVQDVVIG